MTLIFVTFAFCAAHISLPRSENAIAWIVFDSCYSIVDFKTKFTQIHERNKNKTRFQWSRKSWLRDRPRWAVGYCPNSTESRFYLQFHKVFHKVRVLAFFCFSSASMIFHKHSKIPISYLTSEFACSLRKSWILATSIQFFWICHQTFGAFIFSAKSRQFCYHPSASN